MRSKTTNPWVVLVLICLAQFMVILDATIVNVALPSIHRSLGGGATTIQWLSAGYTLAFAVLLIAAQVIAVVFGFFWSSLTPFATPTLLVVYGMWVLSFLLATIATFLPVRAKDPLPRLG